MKPKLSLLDLKNKSIYKWHFLSKVLEAYVKHKVQRDYSAETWLSRMTNELLIAADIGDSSVLILWPSCYISSVLLICFDISDQSNHFENWVELTLNFFKSYLNDREWSVVIYLVSSALVHVNCSVPHGSILSPSSFSIYMLFLHDIYHKYPGNVSSLNCLDDC